MVVVDVFVIDSCVCEYLMSLVVVEVFGIAVDVFGSDACV